MKPDGMKEREGRKGGGEEEKSGKGRFIEFDTSEIRVCWFLIGCRVAEGGPITFVLTSRNQ